jgi:MFS transporter, MHS family, proline/betaine transporter
MISSNTQTFSSLKPEQREAMGLLSIGTFLEYFDIMLYVHMAVMLNELFFPKHDPHVSSLVAAFSFCTTYVFRPIGALIFGWIGDRMGRKSTVIIAILIMAASCFIIAILPTYEQIGITATVFLIVCRIMQGMACTGESTGAELYLTETTKPPVQYPLVAMLTVYTAVGTMAALGIATMVISFKLNWRIIFLFGGGIALVGSIARTALRETPEFADAKRRAKNTLETSGIDYKPNQSSEILNNNLIVQEKVNIKTVIAYFFMQCTRPICFYFAYIHCGNLLKDSFHFTSEQVISHNFIISIIDLIGLIVLALLSYKIYPLKILKTKLIVFFSFLLLSPYLLNNINTPFQLGLIQTFAVFFAFDDVPGGAILYKYFPIFKRFTYTSLLHAIARAFMYVIVSFGLVYLTKYFGSYALLIISTPLSIGFAFGLNHFIKLEREAENIPQNKIYNQIADINLT